jgi:hypothetical protein
MNCRDFRERHLAFLDDALPEADLVAMQRHLAECACCARRDTAIRRGLLVCRNLGQIEPSADFAARLEARIRQLHRREEELRAAFHGPSVSGFLAIAASVLGVGILATVALDWTEPPRDIALAPAVVSAPAEPAAMVDHAYVLSAASGGAMWPAVVLAEQLPQRVMEGEARLVSLTR